MKRALLLVAALAVATAVVSPVAFGDKGKDGKTIYDSTVSPLPGNLPSVGAEAYSFRQFGDNVTFAGKDRKLQTVTVTLSSWACRRSARRSIAAATSALRVWKWCRCAPRETPARSATRLVVVFA